MINTLFMTLQVDRHAFSIAVPGGGQPIPSGVLGGTTGIHVATSIASIGGAGGAKGNAAILALENELTSMSPNESGYLLSAAHSQGQQGSSTYSTATASGGGSSNSVSSALAFSTSRPGLNLYLNHNKLTMMKHES